MTTAPTDHVQAVTRTPGMTLPPTDMLAEGPVAPSSDGWRLILLAMAGFLAASLLIPVRSVARPDRRR